MRAIVTGGAGFIGSHLTEALVQRGDEVICVERPDASRRWIEHTPAQFVPCGVDRCEILSRLFDGADVVFHLAALTEAMTPAAFYAVNTEGTAMVLRAAADLARPPRVVLLSSISAAGPCRNGDSLTADTVPYPLSHYGQSKLLAEATVHAFADRVPATIVRFSTVYGPRERAVLMLFRLVRRGLAITVGSWDREVSVLYVGDAVRALMAVATSDRAIGRTYCIAHPAAVTWRSFAAAIGAELGRAPRLVSVPPMLARGVAVAAEHVARVRRRAAILNRGRLREMIQLRWVVDPTPAMRELEWTAAYPIEVGIHETARWYGQAGWL